MCIRDRSYNAYLLLDEKTVLFDTVDRAITEQFFENIDALLKGRALDYVVVNPVSYTHLALRQSISTVLCTV